jgi:hypothetical protein
MLVEAVAVRILLLLEQGGLEAAALAALGVGLELLE